MRRQATVAAVDRAPEHIHLQQPADDPGRLLDADDVAAYIGMTADWVYREVRAGRLPHIRLGRYVRFRRESIDAWLEASERGARMSPERKAARRR